MCEFAAGTELSPKSGRDREHAVLLHCNFNRWDLGFPLCQRLLLLMHHSHLAVHARPGDPDFCQILLFRSCLNIRRLRDWIADSASGRTINTVSDLSLSCEERRNGPKAVLPCSDRLEQSDILQKMRTGC